MPASDPTDLPDGVPEDRVDALYGLPVDEFTPARDALAKELRGEGRREQADWVKGLRKPSAAAWVVNQLARTQRKEAKRLVAAGEKLRDTHERLLAGNAEATDLRAAAEDKDEAVAALLENAAGLLDADGNSPSDATVEKAGETLQSVALDDGVREEFVAGRLTRERRATGLGLLGAGGAAAPARRAPAREKKTRARGGRGPAKDGAAKRRAEERAAARQALKDAKAEQRGRARAVTAAERELEQVRREAERVQRRLEDASAALEEARKAEADAAARVADAERAV